MYLKILFLTLLQAPDQDFQPILVEEGIAVELRHKFELNQAIHFIYRGLRRAKESTASDTSIRCFERTFTFKTSVAFSGEDGR